MHQEIVAIPTEQQWPKLCNCCEAVHTEDAWEALDYIGIQFSGMDDYPDLELRNCTCGSTISIVVSRTSSSHPQVAREHPLEASRDPRTT